MSEVDPGTEATALTARFICRAAARGASFASPVTGFCGDMPNCVRAASGIMLKGARKATGSAEAGVSNTKNAKTLLARKPFTVEYLHRYLAGRFNRLGKKNYAAAEQHQPNCGYYRPVQLHGHLR